MPAQKIDMQELGQLTVLDQNQQAIPLGSLWKNQTTVLVFVRHFG